MSVRWKVVVGWVVLLAGCAPAARVQRGGADDPADAGAAVGVVAPASRTLKVDSATTAGAAGAAPAPAGGHQHVH